MRTKARLVGTAALVLAVGSCGFLYFPVTHDLGLPFGYYGKVNRILGRISDCPHLEVVFVARHKDLTLEDFWVTVRDSDGVETELAFPNANMRCVPDLAEELRRVGCS